MQDEFCNFIKSNPNFKGLSGIIQLPPIMAQITLFTASRSLQGKEVRKQLDTTFAKLYHDLDDGFQPINFMLPWFPLPQNRRRDVGQRKMTQIYTDIINARRAEGDKKESEDMIWNLMRSKYKDGSPVPDTEIAHMMIGLLMAGQHSSSVTSSWIMLHLAAQPEVMEELYQEQLRVLGDTNTALTYDNIQQLQLVKHVIQETLRLHPPIHSIMRKVKNPLPIEGTSWVVPPSHVLLAAPATMGKSDEYFPNADLWDPHRWENIADPKDEEKEKMDYGYGLVSTGADSTYLPFGAGRHRCIGEQFANVQLTIVVTMMVRNFKLRNPEGKIGVVATDYSVRAQCCCWPITVSDVTGSRCSLGRWSQPMCSGNDVQDISKCYAGLGRLWPRKAIEANGSEQICGLRVEKLGWTCSSGTHLSLNICAQRAEGTSLLARFLYLLLRVTVTSQT